MRPQSTMCYELEDLEQIAGLPEGDHRRAHLAHCPRCRSLLASYLGFMAAPVPGGSNVDDADRRLTAFLEDRVAPADPQVIPITAVTAGRPRLRAIEAIASAFRRPLVRWAVAGGIAAAILVGLSLDRIARPPSSDSPARVDRPARQRGLGTPAGERAVPAESRLLEDGSVALSWGEIPGAEAYRVELYDRDLQVVGSVDAGSTRTIILHGGKTPDLPSGVEPLFWRLRATRARDEVGGSGLLPLPARR